jgi:branched-chain amino acid transport system permease protein
METFIQQILNGLGRGSQYALWTVGYGLVFQVLGLMHFAHGDTLLLGLYIAFAFLVTLTVPLPIAIVLVLLTAALMAATVERVVYRPLVKRGNTMAAFIAALGAAYILRNTATLIWGRNALAFPREFPQKTFQVGGLLIDSTPIIVLALALLIVGGFTRFLRRSRHGQAIVALGQDRRTSALMGINVSLFITVIYALSGVIGMAGALMFATQLGTLDAEVGFFITMKAFFAGIVGGLGRIEGALFGGLLLGVLEALVIGYVSGVYVDAIAFAVLGLLLIWRPTGLFGRMPLASV